MLAGLLHGLRESVPGCHVRRERRIGPRYGCKVSDAAGLFFLSKTNDGHVTGRCALLAGLRTSQIEQTAKPEKGGGNRLDERELERNN